jgi:hypothetical protein
MLTWPKPRPINTMPALFPLKFVWKPIDGAGGDRHIKEG